MASYVASYEFPRTRINNFFLIGCGEREAALRKKPLDMLFAAKHLLQARKT